MQKVCYTIDNGAFSSAAAADCTVGPLLLCFLLFIAGLHITRSYERQSRTQTLPPYGPRILRLSRFQSAVLQGSLEGLLRGRSVTEVATILLWGGGENEDVPPVLGSRTEEKLAAFPGWAGEISQRTAADSEVGPSPRCYRTGRFMAQFRVLSHPGIYL